MALLEWMSWLLPQARWTTYRAICSEEGERWTEERLVLYQSWLGRQWDYMEIIINTDNFDRTVSRMKRKEDTAHGTTHC